MTVTNTHNTHIALLWQTYSHILHYCDKHTHIALLWQTHTHTHAHIAWLRQTYTHILHDYDKHTHTYTCTHCINVTNTHNVSHSQMTKQHHVTTKQTWTQCITVSHIHTVPPTQKVSCIWQRYQCGTLWQMHCITVIQIPTCCDSMTSECIVPLCNKYTHCFTMWQIYTLPYHVTNTHTLSLYDKLAHCIIIVTNIYITLW